MEALEVLSYAWSVNYDRIIERFLSFLKVLSILCLAVQRVECLALEILVFLGGLFSCTKYDQQKISPSISVRFGYVSILCARCFTLEHSNLRYTLFWTSTQPEHSDAEFWVKVEQNNYFNIHFGFDLRTAEILNLWHSTKTLIQQNKCAKIKSSFEEHRKQYKQLGSRGPFCQSIKNISQRSGGVLFNTRARADGGWSTIYKRITCMNRVLFSIDCRKIVSIRRSIYPPGVNDVLKA